MNHDDPKLTAYALGELDPAERAEIEQLLKDDPAAVAEVEETRAISGKLRLHLQGELNEALSAEQRAEVLAASAAAPVVEPRNVTPFWRRASVISALAACIVASAAAVLMYPGMNAPREASIAYHDAATAPAGRGRAEATASAQTHAPAGAAEVAMPAPAEPMLALDSASENLAKNLSDPRPNWWIDDAAAKVSEEYLVKLSPKAKAVEETAGVALQTPAGEVLGDQLRTVELPVQRSDMDLAARGAAPLQPESETAPAMAGKPAAGPAPATSTLSTVRETPADSAYALAPSRQFSVLQRVAPVERDAISKDESIAPGSEAQQAAETATNLVIAQIREGTKKEGDDSTWASQPGAVLNFGGASTPAAKAPARPALSGRSRNHSEFGSEPAAPAAATASLGLEVKRLYERSEVEFRENVDRQLKEVRDERSRFRYIPRPEPTTTTESYDNVTDNAFRKVADEPLSTFSIDVDTASYSNVRRFLNSNSLPPRAAVRIEELVNYFTYDYPQPDGEAPFSSTMEVAASPWTPEHRLVRIGLKGREIQRDQRPPSNLVFLIDVSGSMQPQNKLPLLKQSMQLLVDQLTPRDQVAIVVYAGASGVVLEPTRDKSRLREALDRLESGGSTNGGAGIQLAYDIARRAFIQEGTNRVILATDGDFNVGVTSQESLVELIQREAKSGVFLSVLGFGMDNLKDGTLEKLANKGNGNYAYIDTLNEGRRVLVEQMAGTLITIAKDVKIQVEFNPAQVGAYRLIGYENRLLANKDFNDDTKDAGEIGAGHTVTALYEIVPAGKALPQAGVVDELKYQQKSAAPAVQPVLEGRAASRELLTLKLRYKAPDGDTSKLIEFPLTDSDATWEKSSRDFRFAAAVASFGMLLRDSPHKGSANWSSTLELAAEGKGEDASGYRTEFIGLVEKARALGR